VKVSVTAAGRPVKINYKREDDRLEITLKNELVLSEGKTLEVSINR
jgi:hypothetical protein